MVQINFAKGEVQCKIVYYGPSGSGKTANLRAIKDRTPDHIVGDLTTIATDGDSTLFFDFLPLDLGNLSGIQTKIHLYAAPWQRKQTAVRMLVLQGADGIVFVADRSRRRLDDNKAALQDLHDNLRALGRDFSDLPVVFQWNKSDVEDAMPVEELRMELGVSENADSEAVALKGEGVFRALKNITASVLHEAGAVAKRGTSALRGPAETPTPVAEPVHAAVESTPAAAHEPVAPPEPA
ncbi:MAG: ATP/GTP-binding protein, partial [Planctomycetota bacterium]